MKIYALFPILFLLLVVPVFSTTNDPVKDYLTNRQNAFHRGDDTFFSDDKVLVLNLDLMGNGQIERLVSSTLDRDGKAGNSWTVFAKDGTGWKRVGTMTFHGTSFYLGKIDQLNGQYGIVSFFPSGNQQGSLLADVFNGSTVQETKIGAVTRDPVTRQLQGTDLLQRYFGNSGSVSHAAPQSIGATELVKTYGIKKDARKFMDAMKERHEEAVANH
jgi:hypothetical protein